MRTVQRKKDTVKNVYLDPINRKIILEHENYQFVDRVNVNDKKLDADFEVNDIEIFKENIDSVNKVFLDEMNIYNDKTKSEPDELLSIDSIENVYVKFVRIPIYIYVSSEGIDMGLTTWAAAPEGKIVKSDVSAAKNYLSEKEMRSLERIVSAYLDLAEDRAERRIPMTMEDWAKRLDLFLMADDREVLQDAGKITAEIAKAKAETEFEKYRVIQDRLFMSDFDKYMLELEENAKK